MTHHHSGSHFASSAPSKPYVEVTFVFRDLLQKPIEGLSIQIKAGAGAEPAPAWSIGPGTRTGPSAVTGAPSVTDAASAANALPMVLNSIEVLTDKDGYAVTIHNRCPTSAD
jgi:hypothetical protein